MEPDGDIGSRYAGIRERIARASTRAGRDPGEVVLIGVTKTHPPAMARAVVAHGLRDLGENRVQELLEKCGALADLSIRWHLIGHLQTNKVKIVLPHVFMIHSVDSVRLAEQIQLHAASPVDVCLQVNTSGEETKFGVAPGEVRPHAAAIRACPNLRLRGLMTLGPLTEDPTAIRASFRLLRELLAEARAEVPDASVLSMGMSGDFETAIEEGATHVRVGTALFGSRG
jgi:pyridoxal phosphate enzyme (YggS family)